MVTEYATSRTRLHHPLDQINGRQLLRSPIDQIADENGRTGGMPEKTTRFGIAEMREQGNKLAQLPVDVADHVVVHSCNPSNRAATRGSVNRCSAADS